MYWIRFDVDINAVKDDASEEKQAKERLEREKNILTADYNIMKEKYEVSTCTCTVSE